jgi:hypothetical protein
MSAAAKLPSAGQKGKKAGKEKKSRLRYYIGIPLGLLVMLYIYGNMPIKGTIKYGICKVFIEQRTLYPEELRFLSLLERPNDVRVEYTFVNEFGETQLNTVTCVYRADPNTTLALSDVIINRRKVDAEELDKFNQTIPAILAYPPNTNIPGFSSDDLMDLWREN